MRSRAPWFAMQCSAFEQFLAVITDSDPSDTWHMHSHNGTIYGMGERFAAACSFERRSSYARNRITRIANCMASLASISSPIVSFSIGTV
jgi:hypothetical protein